MLSRTSTLLLKRVPLIQTLEVFRRSVHSYVSSDECILKPGESYSITETGILYYIEGTIIGVRFIDLVKGDGPQCKKGTIVMKLG